MKEIYEDHEWFVEHHVIGQLNKEKSDSANVHEHAQDNTHEFEKGKEVNNLLYRQWLEEELKDISGNLLAGRTVISHNSGKYKKLQDSINVVLEILENHNGEEWLEPEDKELLEEKIHLMKEAALPYMQLKIEQGALAKDAPAPLSKRYYGAYAVMKIQSKLPDNPGPEYGILAPEKLDDGDKEYNSWDHKYKQNIRYLAKKQLYAYEKNLKELNESEGLSGGTAEEHTKGLSKELSKKLSTEEFDALMDLMEPSKILSYKHDGDLCQKYPKMRIKLEQAIRANEKLQNMSEDEISDYLLSWKVSARKKSLESAKKAVERKGHTFTEKDKKQVEEKLDLFIKDKIEKFSSKEALTEKGDELEQVARFVDLKMKVISNKLYVKRLHTNTIGRKYSVKEYEQKAQEAKNQNEKEFYTNLRDIRELEDAGIRHEKDPYETSLYKNINETLHRTVKTELFGFKIGKGSTKEANANRGMDGSDDPASDYVRYGRSMKGRVGKIGLKLHSKHKSISLSGGIVFGQAKAASYIGATYEIPGASALTDGEFSAVKGRFKLKAGKGPVEVTAGGSISAGYSYGSVKGGVGRFISKDENGVETEVYGIGGKAGGALSVFKGNIGGALNIWGLKVGVTVTGYGAGVAGEIGGGIDSSGIKFSFAGALGLGAGISINVNWSGLLSNIKNIWRKSKLKKLIAAYKERKKKLDPESSNPEIGKGSADKKPGADAESDIETTRGESDIETTRDESIDKSVERSFEENKDKDIEKNKENGIEKATPGDDSLVNTHSETPSGDHQDKKDHDVHKHHHDMKDHHDKKNLPHM